VTEDLLFFHSLVRPLTVHFQLSWLSSFNSLLRLLLRALDNDVLINPVYSFPSSLETPHDNAVELLALSNVTTSILSWDSSDRVSAAYYMMRALDFPFSVETPLSCDKIKALGLCPADFPFSLETLLQSIRGRTRWIYLHLSIPSWDSSDELCPLDMGPVGLFPFPLETLLEIRNIFLPHDIALFPFHSLLRLFLGEGLSRHGLK